MCDVTYDERQSQFLFSQCQKVAACTRLSKSLVTFLSFHRGLIILDTILILLISLDQIVFIDVLIMIVINLAYVIYSIINRRQR